MSRTNFDFTKHKLDVKKTEDLLIHHLNVNGEIIDNIKFINTNGICAVTGDYGNWIFCREFHPSAEGCVSDGYWIEKLSLASDQTGEEYDPESTRKEIQDGLDGELEEYGHEGESLNEMREYYLDLLDYVDLSEEEYCAYAYYNFPDWQDAESVPFVKKTQHWLAVIFDAFEEICRRMKEND